MLDWKRFVVSRVELRPPALKGVMFDRFDYSARRENRVIMRRPRR
jgi:hypothetical protein